MIYLLVILPDQSFAVAGQVFGEGGYMRANSLRYWRRGVDNVWEPEKFEARKMLENAVESPPSGARRVGRF